LTYANLWWYTTAVMSQAIRVEEVRKQFGKTAALDGVDLTVEEGTVFGLLGPNGAGKTTMVRILATLIRPDSGRATIAGHDVLNDAASVRRVIGLTGQYAALDDALTGEENLVLIGRLHRQSAPEAKARAWELLSTVGLEDVARRPVRTYSGGMRRRVDLAASLTGRPSVLFLDEPTTGLDPASRLALWDLVRRMVREGTTVLLTTQYMEEVDRLASKIAVLDHGRVIASGAPAGLKARAGGHYIAVKVAPESAAAAVAALAPIAHGEVRIDLDEVVAPVNGGESVIDAVRRLEEAGVAIDELALRRPTLDEVFLSLTAREPEMEVAS
jgi:daunorubicin resistance ABC transporter ATP-binding subunit